MLKAKRNLLLKKKVLGLFFRVFVAKSSMKYTILIFGETMRSNVYVHLVQRPPGTSVSIVLAISGLRS